MHQPVQKKLAIAFWFLTFVDIAGIACHIEILHFIAKPLLVPALLLLLLFTKSFVPNKKILLIGLFFSWLGDMFLLFEDKNALFFVFGLASFLTTHIFYIVYFLRIKSANISLLKKHPILIALVLGYGITLVWQLYPNLKNLKLPVIVYAAVICTMLLCSLHIFLKINRKAASYFLLGASVFVISDSLLAINKFYAQHPADQPLTYAGILIMLTYCAAQYFIVTGFIKQDK